MGPVRLGTSSWTFPGWGGRAGTIGAGLVYDRPATSSVLAEDAGLSAYARCPLFDTVGLDRAFYSTLSVQQYQQLREAVGPTRGAGERSFRFLVKAHQSLTRPMADERGRTFGATSGPTSVATTPNVRFLDPHFAREAIIEPSSSGLGEACGPIVLQFPPLDLSARGPVGGVAGLLSKLDALLSAVPRPGGGGGASAGGACLAVEFRNRVLVTGAHGARLGAMLRAQGVAYGFAHHPTMPSVAEQRAAIGEDAPGLPLVCRWLLRHDQQYEVAKGRYEPFDRIVDPDGPALLGIAALGVEALRQGREAYVIINNKAEGSAPLSVARLAQAMTSVTR
jgi:uncharacterized protein YecE (DUF72 family)